jgi:hypothetical protein
LKPAWVNSLRDPISKNPSPKRDGEVAQGVGPEFKPQYWKKKNLMGHQKKSKHCPQQHSLQPDFLFLLASSFSQQLQLNPLYFLRIQSTIFFLFLFLLPSSFFFLKDLLFG